MSEENEEKLTLEQRVWIIRELERESWAQLIGPSGRFIEIFWLKNGTYQIIESGTANDGRDEADDLEGVFRSVELSKMVHWLHTWNDHN